MPEPEGCNFIKNETLAYAFSCEFCEISKNTLFIEHHLNDCFWFYLWRVFFIFSIIKNFRHEKWRFVRKKSTSGTPALHFESDLPSFTTLCILSKKEWPCRNRGLPYSNLSLVIFRLSVFLFYMHKFRMKNLFRQNFSTHITEAATELGAAQK